MLKLHRRAELLRYRNRVQMVFQDPFGSLNPVKSIAHHIARPLQIHKQTQGQEQTRGHAGCQERDPVPLEPDVEELPRGAALYRLCPALERCEDLECRLGLLDLAHTPLPLFTTAEV